MCFTHLSLLEAIAGVLVNYLPHLIVIDARVELAFQATTRNIVLQHLGHASALVILLHTKDIVVSILEDFGRYVLLALLSGHSELVNVPLVERREVVLVVLRHIPNSLGRSDAHVRVHARATVCVAAERVHVARRHVGAMAIGLDGIVAELGVAQKHGTARLAGRLGRLGATHGHTVEAEDWLVLPVRIVLERHVHILGDTLEELVRVLLHRRLRERLVLLGVVLKVGQRWLFF